MTSFCLHGPWLFVGFECGWISVYNTMKEETHFLIKSLPCFPLSLLFAIPVQFTRPGLLDSRKPDAYLGRLTLTAFNTVDSKLAVVAFPNSIYQVQRSLQSPSPVECLESRSEGGAYLGMKSDDFIHIYDPTNFTAERPIRKFLQLEVFKLNIFC